MELSVVSTWPHLQMSLRHKHPPKLYSTPNKHMGLQRKELRKIAITLCNCLQAYQHNERREHQFSPIPWQPPYFLYLQTNKQTKGSLNIPHSILHDSKFRRSQNIHNDDNRNCTGFRSGTFPPVAYTRFTTTRAQSTEIGLTPHGLSSLQPRQQNSQQIAHEQGQTKELQMTPRPEELLFSLSTELGLTRHGLGKLQSRQQTSQYELHTNRAKLKIWRCRHCRENSCSPCPRN